MIAHPFVYLRVGAVVVLCWRLKAQSAQVNALGLRVGSLTARAEEAEAREKLANCYFSSPSGHVTIVTPCPPGWRGLHWLSLAN
jgi:hypothetical protein